MKSTRNLVRSPLGGILAPYSPKCVEGEFCELRRDGVLGSQRMLRKGQEDTSQPFTDAARCPCERLSSSCLAAGPGSSPRVFLAIAPTVQRPGYFDRSVSVFCPRLTAGLPFSQRTDLRILRPLARSFSHRPMNSRWIYKGVCSFFAGYWQLFASRWTNPRECTYSAIPRAALRRLDQRPLDLRLLTEHGRSHLKVLSVRIVIRTKSLAATLGKPEGAVERWCDKRSRTAP